MRGSKATVVLAFGIGSLMSGRLVKTLPYTRALATEISSSTVGIAEQDLNGWCNTVLRIKSLSSCKTKVCLEYDIPNQQQTCLIEWPVNGLNVNYGIRI